MPNMPSNMFSVEVIAQQLITEDTLLEVYPKSVWFRKVIVGTPDSETITLTNPSAASIALTSYVNSNSEYTITGLSQSEIIGPGATKTFTIDYNPSAGGSTVETGSLTLACDNGQTHVIQIWSSKFDSAITPTPVTVAGNLSTAGANYVLQNDIDVSGTAFIINAQNVSFDLNGYTIKYGSGGGNGVHGVYLVSPGVDPVNGAAAYGAHVYNGTIEQSGYATASSSGNDNHAVYINRQDVGRDAEFSNVTFKVDGYNAKCIFTDQNDRSIWIHDCTFNSKVTSIGSRGNYDGAMVDIDTAVGTRNPRIHDNIASGSPQTTFRCPVSSTGNPAQIYNNTISQQGIFDNDFCILGGIDGEVFNNSIDLSSGSGRGIGAFTGSQIHDNTIVARSQSQYEEHTDDGIGGPGGCQLNGTYTLQFEGAMNDSRVYNNDLTALADECGATVLRFTETGGSSGNKIFRNTCRAIWQAGATKRDQSGTTVRGAFCFSGSGEGNAAGFEITNNEYTYGTGFIYCGWNYLGNVRVTDSDIVVDSNQSSTINFIDMNSFGNGAPAYSTGIEIIDTPLTGDTYDNHSFNSGVAAEYLNGWTLTVVVTSDGSTPISGATVVVDDADALEVSNQTTPANGTVTAELTEAEYSGTSEPGTDDAKTPHNLTITAGGYTTRTPIVTMDSTKTLTVNMTTGGTVES